MPKINRIRIANIAYDGKYIIDEMYDTFNGENVLINLKNGSGKSVLVQLMLQTVNPCISIHGRKMESYLDSKRPSFIFVEWKLDNTPVPTYLLTGIVMIKTALNENNTSRINYFTFVNRYIGGCDFDIKRIPFIIHEERSVAFESYSKCRDILRNNVKSGSDFDYFSYDNNNEYKAKLEENCIYPEEWELIARCNDNEGGISKLFNKIKSSDQLFDEWILKTIIKSIPSGKKLNEMFNVLIESINENDDIIKQKEAFERFLMDVDGYVDNLDELMKQYDKIENIQKEIADIYYFLIGRENAAGLNIDDCEVSIKKTDEQIRHIEYERLSDNYYNSFDKLCEARDLCGEANVAKEYANTEYKKAQRQVNILEAAEIYNKYKATQAVIDAKTSELSRINKGDNETRYNDLVFSLLQEYNKKRLDLEGKISSYKESLIEIKNTLESLDNEKAVIQNNRFELSQKTGRLDESLKSFLNYEKALFDELDIPLIRSITLEYDEADIKFVQDSFKLKRNSLFEMQKTCEKEIECLGVNKEQLKKEEASKHEHSSDLKINIVKSEDDIKQYKISEEKALSAIRNLELSSADLFNMSLNIINLDIKEKNLISKLDGYKLKLNSQKEYLESIKNGSAHISPEFSDKLRKLNIDFEIGEKFLLEEDNEDHRRQLLSNNPMLPFCYIVKRKDYEIIKNTDFEGSINKVIPIITFEDADINASLSKKAVEINDNKMLVCLYNKECIDEQSKKIFIENLENDIEKLQSSAETIQKDLEQFRVNKNDIISFNYERDYFTRKNDELKKFNDSFNITQNRLQVIAEEIKQNDERTALLTQNLNELKLSSVKNNENETRFNKYLDENAVYLSNYNDFQSVKTQISIYEKRYLEIDALIKEFMGNEKDFSDKERKTNSDLEKIKEKASSLDSSIIGEALNLPIEQMEIEYQKILSGIKHSIDEIERAIKSANDQISDYNKKLMRYSDYKDEYTNPNIVFSYEILENAEYNEKNKQVIFETANETAHTAEIEHGKCEGEFNSDKKSLESAGFTMPIDRNYIKRDFENRRKDLKSKKDDIIERKNANLRLQKACLERINKLDNCFGSFEKSGRFKTDDITSINPADLKERLKIAVSEKDRLYKDLLHTFNKVNSKYAKCEYMVILDFISNMSVEQAVTFEDSFAIFERVKNCQECLADELAVAINTLENVENQKTTLIRHAVEHGKKLYNEAKTMANKSLVKIDGRSRQMLYIDIPESYDSDCENSMRRYLEKFLAEIRSDTANIIEQKQKLYRKISAVFADRELLNIVIGKRNVSVSLYKVDATNSNGCLRKWEDVCIENSGAQMFISAFAFISTLMDYTRNKTLEQNGGENLKTTKSFIIDNPFGEMSSKPFMDAMVAVSEKFTMQLICLSDLSQSSITNKFNVIYQLALRTPVCSNKSYLQVVNTVTNSDVHKYDKLEHTSMSIISTEQLSLF